MDPPDSTSVSGCGSGACTPHGVTCMVSKAKAALGLVLKNPPLSPASDVTGHFLFSTRDPSPARPLSRLE